MKNKKIPNKWQMLECVMRFSNVSKSGRVWSSFLTWKERNDLTFTLQDSSVCAGMEKNLRIKLRKSAEVNLNMVINHAQYFFRQANPV